MNKRMTATEPLKRKAEWEARPRTLKEKELMDKVFAPLIKRTKEFLKEKGIEVEECSK